ncbi:MAG: CBS domain-containing protein [Deltaproteobacteria bacterium]|jgi:CBS domain-containing protein|nr:CBS domain-containing protein [Deltaproteobacteria bacterium]
MSLEMFCRRPVVTISPESTVYEACGLLKDKNIGCLVAQEDGKLSGILTDRDIALKVVGDGKDPRSARVRDIMTPNPARISVDKDLHDLTTLMHALHVRRMPIVDGGGKAVGIVTLDDLIVLFADEMWEMGKTVSETFFHKAA